MAWKVCSFIMYNNSNKLFDLLKWMSNIFRRPTFSDPLLDGKNRSRDLFCALVPPVISHWSCLISYVGWWCVLSVMVKLTSFTSLHLLDCWTSAVDPMHQSAVRDKNLVVYRQDYQTPNFMVITSSFYQDKEKKCIIK